jgi:uncharacterized protein (TIGR03000 family)
LTIQGRRTLSTAARRTFVSPPLEVGKTYVYTLETQLFRGGRPITVRRDVEVRAGGRTEVALTAPVSTRVVIGR